MRARGSGGTAGGAGLSRQGGRWSRARWAPLVCLTLLVGACGGGDSDDGGEEAAESSATTVVASATTVPAPTSTTTTTLLDPNLTEDDTITTAGLGEVRIGMTVEDAATAAGRPLDRDPGQSTDTCSELLPRGLDGVRLIAVDGVVAAVSITNPAVTTRSGAAIGDTEERIIELFGERIETTALEGGGNSLAFVPVDPADADDRVIFVSDGTQITRILAGRLPEVEQLDGC